MCVLNCRLLTVFPPNIWWWWWWWQILFYCTSHFLKKIVVQLLIGRSTLVQTCPHVKWDLFLEQFLAGWPSWWKCKAWVVIAFKFNWSNCSVFSCNGYVLMQKITLNNFNWQLATPIFWNNFGIVSAKFPCAEIKLFQTGVGRSWNNSEIFKFHM